VKAAVTIHAAGLRIDERSEEALGDSHGDIAVSVGGICGPANGPLRRRLGNVRTTQKLAATVSDSF
jgi:hypothetical protein